MGSLTHCNIRAVVTISKRASKSNDNTSRFSKLRFSTAECSCRARVNSELSRSTPTAYPLGLTILAIPAVIAPVPQPTSRTTIPGRRRSTRRRWSCCSVRRLRIRGSDRWDCSLTERVSHNADEPGSVVGAGLSAREVLFVEPITFNFPDRDFWGLLQERILTPGTVEMRMSALRFFFTKILKPLYGKGSGPTSFSHCDFLAGAPPIKISRYSLSEVHTSFK